MTRYKAHIIDNARLMTEWDWEENEKSNLDPRKLSLGSGKKVHWVCSKGHKWATSICHRVGRGTNCPYCSNKKVLPGYNDLQSQRPDLMEEWDFENWGSRYWSKTEELLAYAREHGYGEQ